MKAIHAVKRLTLNRRIKRKNHWYGSRFGDDV